MIILALDTTGRAGSAAIVSNGETLAEVSGDPAVTHGQRLPGELMALVATAGITLAAVDLLAVAAGPGSFTGLRVGIAAMQGLAMALGKPIVPVSTLEALARTAPVAAGWLVAPWVDAQRGEVFAALYGPGGELLDAATAMAPAATLAAIVATAGGRPVRFAGDGAVRYAALITSTLGPVAAIEPELPCLATAVAAIAAAAPNRAVAPHAVTPIYVRRPDAEIARDRRPPPARP